MGKSTLPRVELSTEQIAMIERMAASRVPHDVIARILNISRDQFDRLMNRDSALRSAIDRGRALGTDRAYQTAYNMAMGYRREIEYSYRPRRGAKWKQGFRYEDVPPDANVLKFWLKTQEKWKEVDAIEVSGPGGGPIPVQEMDPAERAARIEYLMRLRQRLIKEGPRQITRKQEKAIEAEFEDMADVQVEVQAEGEADGGETTED